MQRICVMAAWVGACGSQTQIVASIEPEVIDESVDANPNSTISAVFTVQTARARTVRVAGWWRPREPTIATTLPRRPTRTLSSQIAMGASPKRQLSCARLALGA